MTGRTSKIRMTMFAPKHDIWSNQQTRANHSRNQLMKDRFTLNTLFYNAKRLFLYSVFVPFMSKHANHVKLNIVHNLISSSYRSSQATSFNLALASYSTLRIYTASVRTRQHTQRHFRPLRYSQYVYNTTARPQTKNLRPANDFPCLANCNNSKQIQRSNRQKHSVTKLA